MAARIGPEIDGGIPARAFTRTMVNTENQLITPPTAARQLELRKAAGLDGAYQPVDFDERWFISTTYNWIDNNIAEWIQDG